jgi:hypothetical protein
MIYDVHFLSTTYFDSYNQNFNSIYEFVLELPTVFELSRPSLRIVKNNLSLPKTVWYAWFHYMLNI